MRVCLCLCLCLCVCACVHVSVGLRKWREDSFVPPFIQVVTDSPALSRIPRDTLMSLMERREDWKSIKSTVVPQFGPVGI